MAGADAWRAADADTLVGYLEDPNPTSVLTLVSTAALPQRLQQVVERVGRRAPLGSGQEHAHASGAAGSRGTSPRRSSAWEAT